jgi:hypothetical protein
VNRRSVRRAALAAALLGLAPVLVLAEDVGRYAAVALVEGQRMAGTGSLQPRVLILDTVEGHLWTWEENVRLDQPGKAPAFGAAVIYQGRVRPGTRIGEVVGQVPRD